MTADTAGRYQVDDSEFVTSVNDWQIMKPLPPAVPAVDDMPEDLIPAALRPWMCDVQHRMQVPLDFVAVPAIVALGSLIGRSVGIYPKQRDSWLTTPNLWGALIGRPGVKKTPAQNDALRPLRRLAHQAQEEHKDAKLTADAATEIIKAKIDAAKIEARTAAKVNDTDKLEVARQAIAELNRELEDAETSERRYIVNDSTVEKLGDLLKRKNLLEWTL